MKLSTRTGPLAVAVAAALMAVGTAPPASGAPLVREHHSETFVDTDTFCGHTWDITGESAGLFMLKQGRHGDLTPYLFDNYSYRVQFLDVATGKGFVQQGNGLFKDSSITPLGGTVYRVEARESGQPFTLRTLGGKVVVKDRGVLVYAFVVDTLGDADIDNDIFADGSLELLADHGSHLGFYLDEAGYCGVVESILAR